jgi:IS30 family transposase
MVSSIQELETRRLNILDGINGGFAYSKIADKLGVHLWVVMSDLKRMRHNRDPELKQAFRKAQAQVQAKKQSVARIPDERFHRMTGMSLKEKTFSNMMSFYEPELMKILESKNECAAIRDLPKSVRRTLKHNGIIVTGWRTPEITALARTYLTRVPSANS